MKLTKEQMRQINLYNSWDIARRARSKLIITYVPAESGSAARYAYWQACGMGFSTDKDTAWFYHGNRSFTVCGRDEKASKLKLKEAIDWCHTMYGTLAFEKDPFGGYQVMGTMRRIANGSRHTHHM